MPQGWTGCALYLHCHQMATVSCMSNLGSRRSYCLSPTPDSWPVGRWRTLKPAYTMVLDWWDDLKSPIKRFTVEHCEARIGKKEEAVPLTLLKGKELGLFCLHSLQQHLHEKIHGARVRARVQSVEAEERPTIRFNQDVVQKRFVTFMAQ
ncbi:hypothetical protein HOLleu_14214 [Holothuria leucospilota]|uniref:Uncharacterized protein n=1 Tax=Holothuria leucospilota TaxID=206669 RepID=A0A9Q1C8E4_HOLLE|nr:hypothetical protein HOLleu_14214 [Holothuria leucospilota]